MKNLSLFFVFFVPIFCFGQVNESFLDGNFINNPIWSGTTSYFKVNSSLQLQSNAAVASTSFLFTPSEAIDDASWECWVKIGTSTSLNNYACIYLISDRVDISSGCKGYYVQVGGKDHEVSLYMLEGTTETKIIDGKNDRAGGNSVEMRIKVTRDATGNFGLYSKLASESDYVLEGTTQNNVVKRSSYFGLMFVNTSSTGSKYYFDDILVSGTAALDKEAPVWAGLNIEQPNKLKLSFSEAMDFSSAAFNVTQGMGSPTSQTVSDDKTSIELAFASGFEKGKTYSLHTTDLKDLAGNGLVKTDSIIGIIESKAVGDLILNELMFENPANSLEYIEIYNKSGKLLDVSNLVLTTRKTDGTLNTGVKIPSNTLMSAYSYLAVCAKADLVRDYHHSPEGSTILTTSSWYSLNNTGSTLVLANAAKDTIYDELTYNASWHNSWVKDAKGISLERTSPDLPTQSQASWHSCLSSSTNYGTPGFENSFYEDKEAPVWTSLSIEQPNKLKLSFSEAMDFGSAAFSMNQGMGSPASQTISDDKKSVILNFGVDFEKGKSYKLTTSGLKDLAGNVLVKIDSIIGIIEAKAIGDLILNEVMFENPANSLEYIEIYNKSGKLLDVSNMILTTRKTDGTLNTGVKIPSNTLMPARSYLAVCAKADSIRNYHHSPTGSTILTTSSWSALNNTGATLLLTNAAKDTIYDELTYNTIWHNSWVKDAKGISLERTSPDLPTQSQASWHSCLATATNYGTPGFENSFYEDKEAPVWTSLSIEQPNKLKLSFSEAMDLGSAAFSVNQEMGNPTSQSISNDKMSVVLNFGVDFEKGKTYALHTTGLKDLAGNVLVKTDSIIGIIEAKAVGDLILNEVMFENPANSLEYIEVYNKSGKLLDVSNLVLTTRKTDGTLNTGVKIPSNTLMSAYGYLAVCAKADSVRNYHHSPTGSTILTTSSWSALNNTGATLVLANAAKDTIYDELTYSASWHSNWVKDAKGISLERTSPDLPTQSQASWHSCLSSSTNYGTPGFENSFYEDKEAPVWSGLSIEQPNKLKLSFSEAMDFGSAAFSVNQGMGSPASQAVSDNKMSVVLNFGVDFEKGKLYKLTTSGLKDLAGNALVKTDSIIGIIESKSVGDLILNEVMFENPTNSLEYIEIYNKSGKLLDVSNLILTTRKTDGTLNTGVKVPSNTLMSAHSYLAVCAKADSVRNYHHCPTGSTILTTGSWSALNNTGATLVLTNAAKDTIYDELTYNTNWHKSWVKDVKGISLERTAPDLLTQSQASWHSCLSSSTNYGTPGFENSFYEDREVPVWTGLSIEQPNKLKLSFSEAMDFGSAAFNVNQSVGNPTSQSISNDKMSIVLNFEYNFEKGKLYKLTTNGLKDLAGNALVKIDSIIGIIEAKAVGDLILNEMMFENPTNSLEYIEIYNKSGKLLDVSNLVLTTRKTDGTLNTGVKIPSNTLMPALGYLAVCAKADSVRNYHHSPTGSTILTTSSWSALNNTGATLVLTNAAKDTVYDELTYNASWHSNWVKDAKGISLERTSPDLPTQSQASWHSCLSSSTNYGTPGFANSFYEDKEAPTWVSLSIEQPNKLKLSFSEAMNFSSAAFSINQEMGSPTSQSFSDDKMSVVLNFASDFEKGKSYKLTTSGLKDLAGNVLVKTDSIFGIIEAKAVGDLILNEVMFENPANSLEYIEVYNKSGKLLDVSNMILTTRKTDGTLNTGVKIPSNTLMSAYGYLAVCAKADSVRNYHHSPTGSTILTTSSWSALNNIGATLVLSNVAKDTVYDELTYNASWHTSWVKDAKGISLERTSPDLPTQSQSSWHSCLATATNYGTPGFENSFYEDKEAPTWASLSIEQPNKLKLSFSEAMDFSSAIFIVDQEIGSAASQTVSEDKKSIELVFPSYFEGGVIYTLETSGLIDLAGNSILQKDSTFGIIEPILVGDLLFNEILFDNPDNSTEYLEIYNNSEKLLNVSDLIFTTRKKDGTLNTGNKIPPKTLMLPHAYLALCTDADSVRNYYHCPEESNIISTKWSSLNNESATLVLTNSTKDTIYDELTYSVKWHHALIKDPKGVSLERINPNLPTQNANSWHSAASEVKHGTPGYENSQYRDIVTSETTEKMVWTEPEAFSPDNDGVDDVCLIHYKTNMDGYVGNVIILNKAGAKICRLASNILLASNGSFIWDGRTDKGKLANVGIYIAYFELFNPEHGIRKQIKLPIVVSSR